MRIFLVVLLVIPHMAAIAAPPTPERVVSEAYYPNPSEPSRTVKRTFSDGATDFIYVFESRETEAGLVRIVQRRDDDDFSMPRGGETMLLGTATIYDGDAITIYGTYVFNGKTYLLIGDNCTGTGCRTSGQLSFLVLDGHLPARIITHKDFFAEKIDEKVRTDVQEDGIVVDLGISAQSEKLAILKNDKVTIKYQKLPYKPLDREMCEELYQFAHDCLKMPEYFKGGSCAETAIKYDGNMQGNAGLWGMRYLQNEPGFNQKVFDKLCMKACTTGKLESMANFGRHVCGRRLNLTSPNRQ